MAKRARLTVNDVLEHWEDSDDEDYVDYDDFDEPVLEGSDDEFRDFEGDDDDIEESDPTTSPGSSSTTPTFSGDQESTWTATPKRVLIQPFTSSVGPSLDIPSSPLEVFDLFFSPDLLQIIVRESNTYANIVMGNDKYEKWSKITVEEVKAFLGFSVLMGINHLPSLNDYWSRDPHLRYAPVADRITRDRFREISRFLHFVDNDTLVPRGEEGHDRLGKVRPLIDHLSTKFAEVYQPHRDIAVDNAMIKFQRRSSLKQYMPLKPTKRGIKVWVAADSTNGYFSRFDVYTGKKGNTTEHGLGARVVKTLTSDFKGKHHHVYFDNFFTSLQLLEDLEKDQIYACGTARKDRKGFPEMLKKAKAMVIKLTVSQTRPHPILVCDRPFLFQVKGQSGSRERR